jgi:DNA-binding NarL/FixJ family response regulator
LLHVAHDAFSQLGAQPWAARAREELRAAGVTPEAQAATSLDDLTPQQWQIAQPAARGLTNREIGAHLFLSPRT